jgi:transposase
MPAENPRCSRPHPVSPDGGALKRIGELYAIESEIRGKRAEERQAVRHQKVPLLASLEGWLREKQKTLSRHSELAKAFGYALNQRLALTRYAEDGWVEVDNIAENALRRVSLGKKLAVLRLGSWW